MADRGHELTEEMLSELEARIAEEYEKAAREMAKKYREYRKAWRDEDKVMRARLKAGEITQKEYADWCYRKTMNGKQWEQLRDALAEDMVRTDQMARALAAQQMPDVFALNGNFATYQVEHGGRLDTGFTLYDRDTAMYLMRDQQLMPGPSSTLAAKIAANKDLQWNKRHIQSAVLQGIMQGESPLKVAARLAGVAQMDYNVAVRYARTMTTDAQNAGRYEGYRRAKKLGVDLKIEWSATLDGRTRHEHRMLDGQRRDVDEPFIVGDVKIMWPAQSSGPGSSDIPQEMIWNCRCTLNAWVKGFEPGQVTSSPKMGGMSYDEWKHAKEPKNKPKKNEEPKYGFAVTVQEAQKQAEELGVKYALFDSWPLERANNAVQAIAAIPKDCRPAAVLNGKDVATITERKLGRKADQWYGVTYDYRPFGLNVVPLGYSKRDYEGGIVVGINTQKFKTLADLTKAKEKEQLRYFEKTGRNWFFNTRGEATAFHEMAHSYINYRGLPDGFDEASKRWANESKCDMLKNPEEAFAEAFAAYQIRDKRLPEYITEFVKDLK